MCDDAGVPHHDDQPVDATAADALSDVMPLSASPTPDRREYFFHNIHGYYPDNQEGLSPSPKTTELDTWIRQSWWMLVSIVKLCHDR